MEGTRTVNISEPDDAPAVVCVQVTGEFERSIAVTFTNYDDTDVPMGKTAACIFISKATVTGGLRILNTVLTHGLLGASHLPISTSHLKWQVSCFSQ